MDRLFRKKRQITNDKEPDSFISSEYGEINYRQWCVFELARLSKNRPNRNYYIKKNPDGKISIWLEIMEEEECCV